MKQLTLEEVKKDISRIEFKYNHYIKISKLIWEDNSLVPHIIISKKKDKDKLSENDWDRIITDFEKNLSHLYEKYKELYPYQYEQYKDYEQYYLKYK